MTEVREDGSRGALWVWLSAWLLAVIALAASGALRALSPVVIPLWVLTTNVVMVRAYRRGGALRAAVDGVGSAWVFSFQALRALIGVSFVYFGAKGVLPEAWAAHAGWGDIVVGVFAAALALGGASGARWRSLRMAFAVIGLADIASVLVHAQVVALIVKDARFYTVAPSLPFAVIPYFVVPLVFATHALLVVRDLRAAGLRSGER
jgi:hypothetical protein